MNDIRMLPNSNHLVVAMSNRLKTARRLGCYKLGNQVHPRKTNPGTGSDLRLLEPQDFYPTQAPSCTINKEP